MPDIVSPEIRSQMMSCIRGKDTKPELAIRKGLHAQGFRYKLHDRTLPGKPDMSFPCYKAVILVNGCFWHGHGCHLFKWPSSREEFWRKKINRNKERDAENLRALNDAGWRVLTIWECALKGRTRRPLDRVVDAAATWLISGKRNRVIQGKNNDTHGVMDETRLSVGIL